MNALLRWIDDRSGLGEGLRMCSDRPLPGGACWCRVWPCTLIFTFCVQAITGFFMWMYFSPSAQTAWESVYFLQHEVAGGWLLRAVHHYSAQVTLVLIAIYLVQMIVTRALRAPREMVFWSVVVMGLLCLGLMLTGDLLAWDQNSYASTKVRVNFLNLLPGVGAGLFKLAAGGPAFGHLTLTRFLALHVGLLSGTFLLMLIVRGVLAYRVDKAEVAELAEKGGRVGRYWPNQAVINAVACLLVMVVVLLLACRHGLSGDHAGVALGAPADPSVAFDAARPEWAFLGLYEFSHLFPGTMAIVPIFIIPGLLVLFAFAMPFFAGSKVGHQLNLGFTAVLLSGLVVLSFYSVWKDKKDEGFQTALATADQQADRVLQLARSPQGIPVGGALTLLRNDPKTRGPVLFKVHCAACHDFADEQDEGILAEESSAPNLYGYASREWLTGFLDARKIASSAYFGNTAFKKGRMAGMVKDWWAEAEADDIVDDIREELATVAIGLSAEAGLKSQAEADEQDAQLIADGKDLIVDLYGCTDCHRFHDKGPAGKAPELTGYGSREWLIDIIANPAHKRFYGTKNDRMPIYAEFPDEPAKNTLTAHDLGLIADWLRGEWYEAP
ncbi:MAG: cytochrome b N-terminal domain-containing protein [Thermoguttaceae bacterium]